MCENAHTPPSLKRGGKRKKDQNKGGGNKPEQKKGHKGMESTDNRAEKAQIAGHVVQRKIVGTLRNRKGTSIHEQIMTVLATWAQQGL